MSHLWAFITAHGTISSLVAYYIASAAIGSLESPTATSGPFYSWFFKFSNTLAGNLFRAFSSKLPGGANAQDAPKQP